MSLRDFVDELRSGEPKADKAARWLRYGGYGCLLVVAWNAAFLYFEPVGMSELPFPPHVNEGLAMLALAGVLLILAGRGVAANNAGAVVWGQLAVVMIAVLVAAFTYWMMKVPERMGFGGGRGFGVWFEVVWYAACLAVSLQFFVPAYFAIGYLRRLTGVLENGAIGIVTAPPAPTPGPTEEPDRYCHALLPFGVHLTFFGLLAAGLLVGLLVSQLAEGAAAPGVFLPVLLLLVFGPILFNYLPSPFQKQRRPLDAATGGGSILLLNGSWPYFRLLIYEDGLEVRFFFHAWFIPYARLESATLQRVFFSTALLIRSDLPKVPNRIRFFSFRKKDLLARIEARLKEFR